MKEKKPTQEQMIKQLLTRFKQVDAYKVMYYWRIMRLAAIIHRLRRDGWKITTDLRPNAKGDGQHAVYKLISKP